MKLLLLIALIIVSTYTKATTKSYLDCSMKIDVSKCDADCAKQHKEKCIDNDSEVQKTDECKDYFTEYAAHSLQNDENTKWSEKLGEKFHECQDKCIDALSGEAKKFAENVKACDAQIGSFAIVLAVLLLSTLL